MCQGRTRDVRERLKSNSSDLNDGRSAREKYKSEIKANDEFAMKYTIARKGYKNT